MNIKAVHREYLDVEIPADQIIKGAVEILINDVLKKNNSQINDYEYFYKVNDRIFGGYKCYHGSDIGDDITDKLSYKDKETLEVILFLNRSGLI